MTKIFNRQKNKTQRKELRREVLVPERILWKSLRNNQLGFKFRRQHGIGKYIVDFYCPSLRLVIEVDGRIHGEEKIITHDKIRDNFLKSLHIIVKRFTAREINVNLFNVVEDIRYLCNTIAQTMANPTPPHPPPRLADAPAKRVGKGRRLKNICSNTTHNQ